MKKITLLLAAIFAAGTIFGQEICDNGIDDDGDNLIDLNDAVDCNCSTSIPTSLIPNPSFEDMSCCPEGFSIMPDPPNDPGYNGLACADGWDQASNATSDFMNICNFTGFAPTPFPDGNGAAGFIIERNIIGPIVTDYVEYLGNCLTSPLTAGIDYQLTFSIAFDWAGLGAPPSDPTCPVDITLFGTPNCNDIPWAGNECPTNGGFMELGSISYTPVSGAGWGQITIAFTPSVNINAIALGGPCSIPAGCGYDIDITTGSIESPYFSVDNLILNQSSLFPDLTVTQTGEFGVGAVVLTANTSETGTYQWYLNGVAILGETSATLNIPDGGCNPGSYQVVFTNTATGVCSMVEPDLIINCPLEVCADMNGDLTVQNGVEPYTWQEEGLIEDCSACFPAVPPLIPECSFPPGCATMVTGWVEFSNGTTVTPPSYPIRIIDGSGQEIIFTTPGDVSPCVICDFPTLSNTFQNPICAGGNDGSIDLTVIGNSTYSVVWDNAETTEDIADLMAGVYIATITDDNNQACFQTDTVTLADGQAPTIDNTVIVGASCGASDGSLQIIATGADLPFNYSIDNGTTFQPANSFTGLAIGNYDVVVEDALGCQTAEMVSVTNIGAPTLDNIVAVDPGCGATDGTIQLTASGGTAPLQYSIDGGTTFQPSGTFSSLAGDTYNIVIEDAGGCQLTNQVILNATTNPVIDNVAATDPACAGADGQIIITASGGTPPFSYSIDNGVTTQIPATFSGLQVGNYDIVVIDAAGCQSTTTATLNTDALPSITAVTPTDLTCNSGCNGILEIDATGGTAPFQYSLDGNNFQPSNIFNTVCAANYNVVVRDANGCETTSNTVTVGTDAYVDVNAIDFTASVVCSGDEIILTAQISDGLAPYTINWNNGDTGIDTTVNPSTTITYQFNVEDGCGKIDQGNVDVTVAQYTVLLDGISDSIICELDEINLYVSAMGGALDQYTFNWTGQDIVSGKETDTAKVVSSVAVEGGATVVLSYTVDVTDHCGNMVSRTVEVIVQDCDLYVPNVFTPGNDDLNDRLVIANLEKHPNSSLQIYSRWGIRIYESDNYQNDWNGGKFSEGVYYYVLQPSDTEIEPLTGYIQLFRAD